ncbi:MAG: hypothetical protein HYR85_25075 [Planctomycetes bacterium]|nr:hypothetical protein [Planctomycetota bacterium]MBI3843290.1 hypothetical protein [Planctomycetota bacterium]
MRSIDDLVRIAAVGGGLRLDASMYSVKDLRRLAAATSQKRARLVLRANDKFTTEDLVLIAAAGGGLVEFEF